MTVNQSDTTNDVDCMTLYKKLMVGYQGWFGCTGDGSNLNCYWHWSKDNSVPDRSNLSVDMLPDISDYAENDKFQTNLTGSKGPALLYSAYRSSVVDLHFKWMKQYQLDGVMLQRFVSELENKNAMLFRDQVASNVKTSAETYGRAFCIMYDITGYNGASLVSDITGDWGHLVKELKITDSKCYLNHKGTSGAINPLLAIWGMGFSDGPNIPDTHPGTPTDALNLINYFKNHNVTILGGVPYRWRTLEEPDSKPDPAWAKVYRSFDVISPWSVGRYYANDGNAIQAIDSIQLNTIRGDLADLTGLGVDYMPVVFPGYSHYNTEHDKNPAEILNRIKRYGGKFWWRQLYNAVDIAECTMIYGAMFDEVNEGTAIFKLVADQEELPLQVELLPLNVEGESPGNLESDHYLWLAGETNKRLKDGIEFTSNMPTRDQATTQPNWLRRALSRLNLGW